MAFQGFGKNTGPIASPKAQIPFGNSRPLSTSDTLPKWGNGHKYIYHDYDAQAHTTTTTLQCPTMS